MGWETRTSPTGRTHGPYYVRKERDEAGRVRSVYRGAGHVAELGARLDAINAERRALERADLRFDLEPIDAALAQLRGSEDRLRVCRDAYLVATGHRSHRGEWRRRRGRYADGSAFALPFLLTAPDAGADPMARKTKNAASAPLPTPAGSALNINDSPAVVAPDDGREAFRARLFAALEACNGSDPASEDVTTLRAVLREAPANYFKPVMPDHALGAVAKLGAGSNAIMRELTRAETERFAVELAGRDAGPLVRAACEQAASARLVLDAVTTGYGTKLAESHALTLGAYYEKRLTAAQTRYLRALATVAALRRAEGDERERAARLAADARASEAVTVRSVYADLPAPDSPRERVREKINRLAAANGAALSGDSLPSPADVELVASAD